MVIWSYYEFESSRILAGTLNITLPGLSFCLGHILNWYKSSYSSHNEFKASRIDLPQAIITILRLNPASICSSGLFYPVSLGEETMETRNVPSTFTSMGYSASRETKCVRSYSSLSDKYSQLYSYTQSWPVRSNCPISYIVEVASTFKLQYCLKNFTASVR